MKMDTLFEYQPATQELDRLLEGQSLPLREWSRTQQRRAELVQSEFSSLDRSFSIGMWAPVMGYAFFAGYQMAISRLLGARYSAKDLYALCVTEASGNSPALIETMLLPGVDSVEGCPQRLLHGVKSFVTGGELVDKLLVLAVDEQLPNGRKAFKLVEVPVADLSGQRLRTTTLPALSLVPEIPHCAIGFDHLPVSSDWVLSGDGYDKYVRGFRWLEDTHVLAALLGFLYSVGRYWQNRDLVLLSLALFNGVSSFARSPDSGSSSVVIYGWLVTELERGLLRLTTDVIPENAVLARQIRRDVALLKLAQSARERREEKVWRNWQIIP
ncbi:MAG: hypothetical protein CSA50_04600 [Gammaproteobacteria bacterium]|nr:MAG: hypothetical protein CSA50_04600 [Gammaproteobacteria bacterium]